MRSIVRLLLALAIAASFGITLAAQDLPAGTKVLAQSNTDTKFLSATVVKTALDGYTITFEDGRVQDVLQADMAYDQVADPAKLAVDVKVAANSYGDFFPGRIYEVGEDGTYMVAWESSGADPVTLENLHLRMAPRKDPRPTPPAVAATTEKPAATSPAAKSPTPAAAAATAAKPAKPDAKPAAPSMAGSDDENPLMAILGMAGDRYLMTYSLTAPTKSPTLMAKTDLADITLDIPQDYVPVGLDFKIKNKSGKALAIDWSKCYISSFAGAKHGVYHVQQQALEDIPAVEKPSDVPAGTEQSFSARSRDGIVTVFHPAEYDAKGALQPKWNEILNNKMFYGPDLPNAMTHGTSQSDQAKDLDMMRKNVIGKSFKVGIALVSGGKTSIVEFTIHIDDLKKSHEANMLDDIGK